MPEPIIRFTDGTSDFSSGVNAARTPTVQSQSNPYGLPRTALAWLTNGSTRDGGISSRTGWQPLIEGVTPLGLFQGHFLYEPTGANPYLVLAVAGRIYRALLESPFTVTDLSAAFGLSHPATQPYFYFCQGEEFLVIQAGDGVTLPLFWDGTTLRRSNGLTNNVSTSEMPAAGPMVYYGGRLWFAQDYTYTAGDIVRGPSGTSGAPYYYRDSILKVTENPLAFGGDGFSVPTNAGIIRALSYPTNIDTQLGQGPLIIGTRKGLFSATIPVTRTAWTSTGDNQPVQVIAAFKYGPTSDRSFTHVNGDLFYMTMVPDVRSMAFARRNQGQWSNKGLSRNVRPIVGPSDRSLLRWATSINYGNRLWQSVLPYSCPAGVAHRALTVLDFDPLSTLEDERPPCWEGHYEGMPILQMAEGDFGGLQRGFGTIYSDTKGTIDIWEFTQDNTRENGDSRITVSFVSPAFTWGDTIGERILKRLVGGELQFDSLYGTALVKIEYRVDFDKCWRNWTQFEMCSARTSAETDDIIYPEQVYGEGYRLPRTLPKPPASCSEQTNRPSDIGYQFQVRVTIKGWTRVRALFLHAEKIERNAYYGLVC